MQNHQSYLHGLAPSLLSSDMEKEGKAEPRQQLLKCVCGFFPKVAGQPPPQLNPTWPYHESNKRLLYLQTMSVSAVGITAASPPRSSMIPHLRTLGTLSVWRLATSSTAWIKKAPSRKRETHQSPMEDALVWKHNSGGGGGGGRP